MEIMGNAPGNNRVTVSPNETPSCTKKEDEMISLSSTKQFLYVSPDSTKRPVYDDSAGKLSRNMRPKTNNETGEDNFASALSMMHPATSWSVFAARKDNQKIGWTQGEHSTNKSRERGRDLEHFLASITDSAPNQAADAVVPMLNRKGNEGIRSRVLSKLEHHKGAKGNSTKSMQDTTDEI
jgi:hypothetical protein